MAFGQGIEFIACDEAAHIVEFYVESTPFLWYTIGESMENVALRLYITVHAEAKGETHMPRAKIAPTPAKNKSKVCPMVVSGVRTSGARARVGNKRAPLQRGSLSQANETEYPTIFAKGSGLYIVDAKSADRSNAKLLTRKSLRTVDSEKIRIDTRGMSRVQIASIMKAISDK